MRSAAETHRHPRTPVARRLATGAFVVVLSTFLTTCKLSDLVNLPPGATLEIEPLRLLDSAAVGSTAPRVLSATVTSDAASIAWVTRIALSSPWLSVAPPRGTAPGSVTVTLDPTGLTAGVYRDTVIVAVEGPVTTPVAVPVEFHITSCAVHDINLPAALSDTLTTADCAAPHRPGRFARLYRFTAAANDSVSLNLAYLGGQDAWLVLDSAPGGTAPALAENDDCTAGGGASCLRYLRLPRTGTYVVEATTAVAGAAGAFLFTASLPRPPAPTGSLLQLTTAQQTIAVGAVTDSGVMLGGTLQDPDGDSVRLEIELRPVGTAFTGTPTTASAWWQDGASVRLTMASLLDNTDYHWQARTLDRTGRASAWTSFGGNAETAADFRVSIPQTPLPAASLAQVRSDGTTAIAVGGTTDEAAVLLRALVDDPDAGDQLRLEVEVQPVGTAFTGTASGSSTPVARGSVATATIAGLNDNVAYHWQARAVDQTGRLGPWVPFGANAESAADFSVALAPVRLTVTVQPGTAVAGAVIAPAIQVAAQDGAGSTLASFTGNVTVALAANPGGGTLAGTTTVAAVGGIATFANLSLDRAGPGYILQMTAAGLNTTTAPFTVNPGAATRLVFSVQPANATAGSALTPPVQVAAHDALGNVATGFTGTVAIALGANPGGATLSGTTSVAAVSGIASFAALSLDRNGTGYTLSAAAAGLTGATSAAFDITPSTATRLGLATPPSNAATSGAALVQQPVIVVQDAIGNAVAQAGITVTATIATGPSGGALTGATATTDGSGQATFTTLALTGLTGSYTLAFGAPGLTAATSAPITLSAGPPARLDVATQPAATAQNTVPFAPQPQVRILDAAGNPVSQAGTTVTAAIASGGGSLGGTAAVQTNPAGVAVFTDLAITGTTGPRTLRFTATGLAEVTSAPVALAAGPATAIAVAAGNGQSALAGAAVAVPPAAIVTDVSGNPVAGVAVTFAVAGGGGTVVPTTAVATGVNGVAAVTSWTLGAVAGPNTLSATATGLTGSPLTFTATGTVGTATQIAKLSGDNLTGPVGTTLATPHEVLVTDATGNPVPGVSVAWTAASGGGSVSPGVGTTDAAGRATATRTLGPAPGPNTTTAAIIVGGSPVLVTFTATATVGGASQMALNGGDAQVDTVGATLTTPLSVLVRDALNNPVQGVTISWAVVSGGGSVAPVTSITDASGIAATSWTLGTATTPTTSTQAARATGVASPVNFVATANPGNVSAAQTTVAVVPTTITASTGGSTATVTVTVRDGFGNPISGQTVVLAVSGSGNVIGQPSTPTGATGVTTGTISSSVAETKTISATIGLTLVTQTASLTVAAAAQTITFAQPASPATFGTGFAIAPTASSGLAVTVLAAGGCTISGSTVTMTSGTVDCVLTASQAGDATYAPATDVVRTVSAAKAAQTITFTAPASPAVFGTTFAVAPTASSGLLVGVLATGGCTISSGTVTMTSGTTDCVLTASQPGNADYSAATDVVHTVTAARAGQIITFTAPATPATYGSTFAVAPTASSGLAVTVTPAGGCTIAGSTVTMTSGTVDCVLTASQAGDASYLPAANVVHTVVAATLAASVTPDDATKVSGDADPTFTGTLTGFLVGDAVTATYTRPAGETVGTYPISATLSPAGVLGNYSITYNTGTLTVTVGAADAAQTDASVPSGTAGSTTMIIITVRDANGNVRIANDDSGLLAVSVSGANTANPTVVSEGLGTYSATYTPTVAGTDDIAITLSGSPIGGGPYTSTVSPGTPTQLVFTVQPSDVTVNQPIAPAVVVTALDANNNVTTYGGDIELAIGTDGAGTGSVLSGGIVTAINGVATFNALSINQAGPGFTLTAAFFGSPPIKTSGPFTVN